MSLWLISPARAQDDKIEALRAKLNTLEAAPVADPQNAPLYWLKIEQARLWEGALVRYIPTPEITEIFERTVNRAAVVGKTVGDAAKASADFQERAYYSPLDNSTQPFYVALPANYSPRQTYPLIVFLHGYSLDITKATPWMPPQEILDYATKRGFLLAIPYGRRNSDFVQWGEDDTLTVLREVKRLYSVDENRVFLCGASMGGFGAYAVGLHHAQEWAAVAPICGRTDFYLWFKTTREAQPAWKRLLYDADEPRFLSSNARNTNYFVQHGTQDMTVSVEHSRRYVADAREKKLPLLYREDPNGTHWSDFQISAIERAFNWLKVQQKAKAPRRLEFVTGDLKAARHFWASIKAFSDYGEAARLTAQIGKDNLVEVWTRNVAKFRLDFPQEWLKAGQKVEVRVNGEAPRMVEAAEPFLWQLPNAKLEKSPEKCGPFKNALRDPVLLVFGDETDQKAAQKFREEWYFFLDGWPPIKSAAQVTPDDKAKFNLVLFGTRETNPLLAEISDQLPLELTPGGYRIGKTEKTGEDLGLRLSWKSPWNPKRLILVCSGLWWGENMPPNHKWDLIPDFIVYNETFEADNTNHALEAGYFDGDWNLRSESEAAR